MKNNQLILFIGWSGPISHAVAQALYIWIPQVIPFVKPWVSSQNVAGGKQWNLQLEKALKDCHAGIICITDDNVKSEWLHFEAGSIGLRNTNSLLIPYLFDVSINKLSTPLSQFHSRTSTLDGTILLVDDILNYAKEMGFTNSKSLNKNVLNKFPLLEHKFEEIKSLFGTSIETAFNLQADMGINFHKILDDKTEELVLTEQNFQGLLRDGIIQFFQTQFKNKEFFKVLIILAKPEFFSTLSTNSKDKKDYQLQFFNTLKALTEFKNSLPIEKQNNFSVLFHPGVCSLSAIFRDPSSKTRGLAAIIPKWATDAEPDNRIFCIIDRATNDYLFHRLYGHIGIMNDKVHSETLEKMFEKMKIY